MAVQNICLTSLYYFTHDTPYVHPCFANDRNWCILLLDNFFIEYLISHFLYVFIYGGMDLCINHILASPKKSMTIF